MVKKQVKKRNKFVLQANSGDIYDKGLLQVKKY